MATTKYASKLYTFMVVLTIIVWIGSLVVQSVFMTDGIEDLDNDIVNKTHNDDDDHMDSQFGPASWAFSIWFVIYSWQAVFLLYSVLSIFPKFDLHRVPITVYPFYILTNLGGAGWTVLSERYEWYWPDLACIAAMPVGMYISFIISIRSLKNRDCKYFLYTYAVHNAWAILAGWTTVATLLWLSQSLVYADKPHMGIKITATIMFAILMAELAIFCTLELTVLDKYLRHVWSHYIALVVAVTGSIIKNWDPTNRNTIMAVSIAGFLTCACLLKLVKMLNCVRPDKPNLDQSIVSTEKKYLV